MIIIIIITIIDVQLPSFLQVKKVRGMQRLKVRKFLVNSHFTGIGDWRQ